MRILQEVAAQGWFNIIHLCGILPMFDLALDYPVQCFNWDDQVTPPTLAEARAKAPDATLVGGLERMNVLLNGSPDDVVRQALDAFEQAGRKRFMLSAGCTIPPHMSKRNLRAARRAVEMMAG
jgi:uroporphyrinogen-III decarboxylase